MNRNQILRLGYPDASKVLSYALELAEDMKWNGYPQKGVQVKIDDEITARLLVAIKEFPASHCHESFDPVVRNLAYAWLDYRRVQKSGSV